MGENIEHIVINGGGPLLFNMYGAMKQSNLLKMWNHENIKTYYGTSAGAILSTVVALKYDWEELDNYLINRPWQHVFKFNVVEIYDYYTKNGIIDENFLREFFLPLFKAKDIEIDVTMEEFRKITGVTLHIYATEIATFDVEEFSADKTPNVKVLDAVYVSSALPILFKPISIENKFYIDGSVYMNYPVARCLERTDNPEKILGIKNKYDENTILKMEETNMFDYLTYIINSLFTKSQTHELMTNREQINKIKEINISSRYEDLSNFFKMASSSEERRCAIQRGVDDINKIIEL